ncbi:putative NTE family protein [Thermoflexales bacterium]|nr:putative NTE family protein [Thermoflexales bacterium]
MTISSDKRIGLALSGGVSRGPAHIGVLNVLKQEGIPIDFVAGVSAGSIIGAAFCAGVSLEKMNELARQTGWRRIAQWVWPRRGFLSFKKLERFLAELIGDVDFQELKIPLAVIATDLLNGEPVVLKEGRVATAVHASCAVPGFIEPVERNGLLLGDGGVSCNLPGRQVRALGADYVIGVDLMQPHLRRRSGPFRFGALALETLIQGSGGGLESVDCLIRPALAGFNSLRFGRAEYLIGQGECAARQQCDTLRSALRESPHPHLPRLPSVPGTPAQIA